MVNRRREAAGAGIFAGDAAGDAVKRIGLLAEVAKERAEAAALFAEVSGEATGEEGEKPPRDDEPGVVGCSSEMVLERLQQGGKLS